MQKTELAMLLRVSKGDVLKVALHIFQQQKLTKDDHEFLYQHIQALTLDFLMEWIARKPPRSAPIVEALFAQLPQGSQLGWFAASLEGWPARLDPEALEDIAERLRTRVDAACWWDIARHLRGMSPFFHGVLERREDCDIAAWLFPHRRDDMACREALRAAAASGDRELTSLDVLTKIGEGPAFHDGTRRDAAGVEEGKAEERDAQLPLVPVDAGPPQAVRTLRGRASVVAWLESRQMLEILSPEDALPAEVPFEISDKLNLELRLGPSEGRYLLTLALHWPGDAAERIRARAWYVAQFLAAARRGVRWSHLVTELVGPSHGFEFEGVFKGHTREDRALAAELLDEIAWASLDGPVVAPWLVQSVYAAFQRGEPDAWERAFRYLDRCFSDPGVLDVDPAEEGRLVIACRSLTDGGFQWMQAGELVGWVLLWAPLPEGADEAFEERLFSYMGKAPTLFNDVPMQFARRVSFPITPARAARLLAMVLENPNLLRELPASKLSEMAAAVDPLPPDRLPAPEVLLRPYRETSIADAIAAYRRLGGAAADARLHGWAQAPLRWEREGAGENVLGYELPEAPILVSLQRAQLAPDLLLTEDLKQELAARSRGLPVLPAARVHAQAPWLLDEATLVAIAEARAEEPGERWCRWPDEVDLPASIASAVRRRARVVADGREFLALARWLARQGEPPADLVSLALDRIAQRPMAHDAMDELMRWLATVLSSRTLWEQHGPRVMEVLVQQKAWAAIYKLMRDSARQPDPATGEAASRPKLLAAMHEALAVVLLRRLKAAIQVSDAETASAALQALVALHPPSRLSRKLYELKGLPSPSPEVSELLALNLRLLRKRTTGEASLSDIDAALSLLADTSAA
ncbi:hypothetical protein [Sorangium sp. So ce124]|uniref:hypothetical protein n=1 Tax=Sorangium sp. So ce124 TaxID=3133280 RepID=UPI003F636A53